MRAAACCNAAQARQVSRTPCARPHRLPAPQRSLVVRALDEVDVPPAFAAALQQALARSSDSRDGGDSSESSGGYSRSNWRTPASSDSNGDSSASSNGGYSRSNWRTPARPPPQPEETLATPLLQVVATALSQSRNTLERLQGEEAEIEQLIQRERKQIERLQWLLEKIQQDYAYFSTVQRHFDQSRR